ncbi:MAG: hypothetical protein QM368_05990 [Bacillota bacterium]|jgi:hypothetical protein|nr:hypothetical protein [Bacillota bacterium]HHU30191.1 hypothetical protein [Bacillota bacterium]
MRCPICNSIDVGKVETDLYYCWNCLHGFSLKGADCFSAYYVDEEGALVSLSEMVQNSQLPQENIWG